MSKDRSNLQRDRQPMPKFVKDALQEAREQTCLFFLFHSTFN